MLPLVLLALSARQDAPMAKTPQDVAKAAASGFATLGGLGFGVTFVSEAIKRSDVQGKARSAVPYFVMQASMSQGLRLGKVSAGFAGGRALGQLIRGVDDMGTAMIAACAAGILSSPTVQSIPTNVLTFMCFSYFIDSFTGSGTAKDPDAPPVPRLSPGQRLDKLLGTTPAPIAA